jgi:hypothetical protein
MGAPMSDDRTGLFIEATPEELAAWETTAAVVCPHSGVAAWARINLNCQAAFVERNLTGSEDLPEWWRRLYEDEPTDDHVA